MADSDRMEWHTPSESEKPRPTLHTARDSPLLEEFLQCFFRHRNVHSVSCLNSYHMSLVMTAYPHWLTSIVDSRMPTEKYIERWKPWIVKNTSIDRYIDSAWPFYMLPCCVCANKSPGALLPRVWCHDPVPSGNAPRLRCCLVGLPVGITGDGLNPGGKTTMKQPLQWSLLVYPTTIVG